MQWFCFGYGQGQTSHQRNLLGFILIIPPNGYFVMFPDNFANQAVHFIGLSISEGENISLGTTNMLYRYQAFQEKKLNTVSEMVIDVMKEWKMRMQS